MLPLGWLYLGRPVWCQWPLFLHRFYTAEVQRYMMSTVKTELCTGLAWGVKTAVSILQDKQSLPEVPPDQDKIALWVCVRTYVNVPIAIPSCFPEHTNAKNMLFPWCPWTPFLWGKTEMVLKGDSTPVQFPKRSLSLFPKYSLGVFTSPIFLCVPFFTFAYNHLSRC